MGSLAHAGDLRNTNIDIDYDIDTDTDIDTDANYNIYLDIDIDTDTVIKTDTMVQAVAQQGPSFPQMSRSFEIFRFLTNRYYTSHFLDATV